MWKYPDGTFRQNPPARVEYAGYIRDFADLTPAQRDELGYNEAVPLKREPYTTYETKWELDGLVYKETIVSATVDSSAKLSNDIAEIEKKYAAKLAALDASLINALWSDGDNEATVRTALSAKRATVVMEKTAEINALFGL